MKETRTFIFRLEKNRLKTERRKKIEILLEKLNEYKVNEEIWGNLQEYYFKMETTNPLYQELVENVKEAPSRLDILPVSIELIYTEEEKQGIVAYVPKRIQPETIDMSNTGVRQPFEECKNCRSVGKPNENWVVPRVREIKRLNKQPRIYSVLWDLDELIFVSLPMYEYLKQNNVSDEVFLPVFQKGSSEAIAYQLYWEQVLPREAFTNPVYRTGDECKECGVVEMQFVKGIYEYRNVYLDASEAIQLKDVNRTFENYFSGFPQMIFSKRLHDLIVEVDKQAVFYPVFGR